MGTVARLPSSWTASASAASGTQEEERGNRAGEGSPSAGAECCSGNGKMRQRREIARSNLPQRVRVEKRHTRAVKAFRAEEGCRAGVADCEMKE